MLLLLNIKTSAHFLKPRQTCCVDISHVVQSIVFTPSSLEERIVGEAARQTTHLTSCVSTCTLMCGADTGFTHFCSKSDSYFEESRSSKGTPAGSQTGTVLCKRVAWQLCLLGTLILKSNTTQGWIVLRIVFRKT